MVTFRSVSCDSLEGIPCATDESSVIAREPLLGAPVTQPQRTPSHSNFEPVKNMPL